MSTSLNIDPTPVLTARRVLIVEDDFLIRLTLAEVLSDEGYKVFEAESGDEALKLIQTTPDVAILLTDIQLPGVLDGRALVRRARETRPDLPVIFMTGRPVALDANEAGGKEMYVAKPYLPSEICTAVRRMLASSS